MKELKTQRTEAGGHLFLSTKLMVSIGLVVGTFVVFWPLSQAEFLTIDDPAYVTDNRTVLDGITWEGLLWAFTTTHAEFWHPITWLSHMLDVQVYGLNPGGHHFTSLFLHLCNSLLLFFCLRRMTGAIWRSGIVAALFAFHPLHVETVAWVADRKDVLCTLFFMTTLLSYAWYTEKPGFWRYLSVFLNFALGLLCKPMLVTLPCVLLLLDWWPLARVEHPRSNYRERVMVLPLRPVTALLIEKLPLLLLAMITSLGAVFAQQSRGGLVSLSEFSFPLRIANALVSYIHYIIKTVWPANLTYFYPFPDHVPLWQAIGTGCLILLVFTVAAIHIKKAPYLAVGICWYLGTLVPVIGIIKVGGFAMADRYTYIPLIGIFLSVVWGLGDIIASRRPDGMPRPLILAIATVIGLLMVTSFFQTRVWKDSDTLFRHALKVNNNNYSAHYSLGHILAKSGRFQEAAYHFQETVRIKPDKATFRYFLARALTLQGNYKEALMHLRIALEIYPAHKEARKELARILERSQHILEKP